jgi:micrococcal nuclease
MNHRRTSWLLFAFSIAIALVFSGCTISPSSGADKPGELVSGVQYHTLVTNVVDGDTFDVQFPEGTTERIRILGVDTPETTPGANIEGEYGNINDTALLADWGVRAESYARSRLTGKEVVLEIDRLAGTRDRYGRVLAYVTTPDGTDFGGFLLREGLARVYTAESFSRKNDYIRLEQEARSQGTGIWGKLLPATPNMEQNTRIPLSPVTNPNSRPAYSPGILPYTSVSPSPGVSLNTPAPSAGLYIVKVIYDPPGDDRADPNGEYIILSNAGPGEEDLAGWIVREGGGVTFTFPPGLIRPGSTVTLHTGKGTGNGTSFYWNRSAPLLNNDGDTVTLLDPTETIISTCSWGQ